MQQSKRDVCTVNDATEFLRSKKTNESPDYGSWVPKPFLYSFLGVGLIFLLVSHFFPIPLFAQLILWGFAGIACLGFLSMGYLYYVFNRNGSEIQNRLRDMVLNRLTWDGTGKALDIGTGNGPLAINMAKKFPKATVTGIDSWGIGWGYSRENCENNARIEGVQERVWFQNASAASLPFEDGEFDAVVSNFVFHEVRDAKDKRNLIKEALRVLREGGVFSFQDQFLNERLYGPINDLLKTVQSWAEKVYVENTVELTNIPRLLRINFVFGKSGILYGMK